MKKFAERIASGVNAINMKIAVYRQGKHVDTYDANLLRYVITVYNGECIPYVTDGIHHRRLSNGTTWTDALAYVRAFEGLALYGANSRHGIHGIELTELRFHKNQYSKVPLNVSCS